MLDKIERLVLALNKLSMCLAGIVLFLMIALGCLNMLSRFFGFPVKGAFELMGFAGALAASLALGKTEMDQGHIVVDILSQRFAPGVRNVLEQVSRIMVLSLALLAIWKLVDLGVILKTSGELSETLHFAYYPVVFVTAFGFVCLALAHLLELFKLVLKKRS